MVVPYISRLVGTEDLGHNQTRRAGIRDRVSLKILMLTSPLTITGDHS